MEVRKASISKSDLRDHLMALALVPFDKQILFPIRVLLQQCAPFSRHYHLIPKIEIGHSCSWSCSWSWHCWSWLQH